MGTLAGLKRGPKPVSVRDVEALLFGLMISTFHHADGIFCLARRHSKLPKLPLPSYSLLRTQPIPLPLPFPTANALLLP